MDVKKIIIIVAAVVAVVTAGLVGAHLLTSASQAEKEEASQKEEPYENVELKPSPPTAQELESAMHLDPSQIEGLEKADWLTDSEKTQLVNGVEGFFKGGGKLNEKKFKIVGDHSEADGVKELVIRDLSDKKKYVCNVGKMFQIHDASLKIAKEQGKSESSESASKSSASAEAKPAEAEGGVQEKVSDYTSVETPFDSEKAYPLSKRDKVEPLITKRVANRLMKDIDNYISAGGFSVSKEDNVLVASDKPKTDGEGIMSFRALVRCGNDRFILNCLYDTKSDNYGFDLMP